MIEPSVKTCQRCSNSFICQPENIADCQCSTVVLDQQTRDYLAKTRYDCLCKNCLLTLNELILKAAQTPFPTRPPELEEDIHYYKERGLWVFTEFYHLQRGYCCGNRCRHCAYGIHLNT